MVETHLLDHRYDEEILEQTYDTLQTLEERRQPLDELYDNMDSGLLYHLIDTADDLDQTLSDPYIDEITVEMEDYQELMDAIDDALQDTTVDDRLRGSIEQHSRFDDGYDEAIEAETVSELNGELEEIQNANNSAVTKRALALKVLPAVGAVGGAALGPAALAAVGGFGGIGAGLYSTIERWSYGRGRETALKDEIAEQSMDNITDSIDATDIYVAVEDERGYTGRPLSDEDDSPSYDTPSEEEKEKRNQQVIEFVEQFEDIDR